MVGYKYKDSMIPETIETATLNDTCDLRVGACTAQFPSGGEIRFSINPIDIHVLKPLTLQVKTKDLTASSAYVNLVGIGMDMGSTHSTLVKKNMSNFKGDLILPMCSERKMYWEARVFLQTNKGLVVAPFRFYTIR